MLLRPSQQMLLRLVLLLMCTDAIHTKNIQHFFYFRKSAKFMGMYSSQLLKPIS